ncbi:exonuclease SbcCD subunit D [Candidatus Woesearchaeota archaeon]|nr:exonuclease SbcCD subunit D [Candidatus Woesearchaeota archaeon]
MKFAHMADCHIGSWQRTPKLADASITAFMKAMDICAEEKVDFILISGDLFDTSMPALDKLKEAVAKLKEIKDTGIPVYVIAGSHDYSPTGKTMLDVLEKAGLFTNVSRSFEEDGQLRFEFTVDRKTGAKIVGILGKKGGLEKHSYSSLLKKELEAEKGFKIFMLHSGIEEYKPKHLEQMEAIPLSSFPKGFDYYAAGHIHGVFSREEPEYGLIAFPGPLFPNNFDELEKLHNGGFYIAETVVNEGSSNIKLRHIPIKLYDFLPVSIDCNGKTPQDVELELLKITKDKDFSNTIVGLRAFGTIKGGKTTDINFREIISAFYSRGAHCVLKNSYALTSEFFEEKKVHTGTVEELELSIMNEHIGQAKIFEREKEMEIAKSLMQALGKEKDEGERQADFDARLIEDVQRILDIRL